MGFAAVENILYIYRNGYQESGWEGFWILVVIRVILVGWMHPFFTSFTGIGVAIARLSRNTLVKMLAVPAGYIVAVMAHAFHNTFSGLIGGVGGFIAGTFVDYIGYTFMIAFIIWLIVRERNVLKKTVAGRSGKRLYLTATICQRPVFLPNQCVYVRTDLAYIHENRSLLSSLRRTRPQKRTTFNTVGDERGNLRIIEQLRSELLALAPAAKT